MATKITDLPAAPSEWRPTGELRWVHRLDNNPTSFAPRVPPSDYYPRTVAVLQQRWKKYARYYTGSTLSPAAMEISHPTDEFEWRDVPIETE